MRIAYRGTFLAEGLLQAGHEVLPLPPGEGEINDLIAGLGQTPDLVLLEVWPSLPLPGNLAACPHRLAAWCIDAPLNEYWIADAARLFDDVFVDQSSTAGRFQRMGLKNAWLPLCALEQYFRSPTRKTRDIVFVGTLSPWRVKRANLLTLLKRHFTVHVCQNASTAAMIDLFATSRLVLNENLFDGLTLRVFQGLASGSALLTEKGRGMGAFFKNGRDLITYAPRTLIATVEAALACPERLEEIGRTGQENCRRHHTSRIRALQFLKAIETDAARNPRLPLARRRLAEALARYRLLQRSGGSLLPVVAAFRELAAGESAIAARAALELGDIEARASRPAAALPWYEQAKKQGAEGLKGLADIKMAALSLQRGETEAARRHLAEALLELPGVRPPDPDALLQDADPARLYFQMGRLLAELGSWASVGFARSEPEQAPDTALDALLLSWRERPDPECLDLMLECAARCGVEGELLGCCLEGIRRGALTGRQIARAAELAERYYNPDMARALLAGLRVARRTPE